MRNRGWIGLALVAVGLAVVPLLVEVLDLSTFYLVFLSGILFWTAQSTSWNILSGYSGYFSFGQGAFYGVGVYSMAVLFGRHGLDWLVALAIGGLLAMLLGLGIGFVAFRLRSLRGEIFALLTLAVPFILAALVRLSDTIDGGQGIVVPVPEFPEALGSFQSFFYVCSAVVGVFALTVAFVMERTRYGWALFAVRDDEAVAEGLGVPTFRHKMIAIAANGLIGGVSGAVFGLNLGFISVEGTFNLTVPLFVIVMSVLGGRNHWAGPMLGAVYIHTLQNRLADSGFEGWSLIVLGGILILLVVLAPEGLMARMRRRPWLVSGALVATLLGLGLWGGWGQPVPPIETSVRGDGPGPSLGCRAPLRGRNAGGAGQAPGRRRGSDQGLRRGPRPAGGLAHRLRGRADRSGRAERIGEDDAGQPDRRCQSADRGHDRSRRDEPRRHPPASSGSSRDRPHLPDTEAILNHDVEGQRGSRDHVRS
jgi:branched-chain amino acid transport system permease protein